MEVNDIANFQQHLKFEIDGVETVVGYVSASVDKTSLQYGFNIQIFNKEFYNENQEAVDSSIINFYKEIGDYLSPQKPASLLKMLGYQK